MHCKILDNTVLSAFRHDIRSVDVMGVLASAYPVVVTDAVASESEARPGGAMMPDAIGTVSSRAVEEASGRLMARFRRLHRGECTAIALSVLLSHEGIGNYLVTDDGGARRVIGRIGADLDVDYIFGFHVEPISLAGTVGLVMRLRSKGLLSSDECAMIADDLENDSTFRVTRELLDSLRTIG